MSTAASPRPSDVTSIATYDLTRIVVMGVSGCGKSSIGAALAKVVGGTYTDGDDLHPAGNIARMAAGIPLRDEDRWPWLDRVGDALQATEGIAIIGCSALKRAYRDRIRERVLGPVLFVHLAGDKALIAGRMTARPGHFMPATLLDSQFEALEPPAADEQAVTVGIEAPLSHIIPAIVAALEERTS